LPFFGSALDLIAGLW